MDEYNAITTRIYRKDNMINISKNSRKRRTMAKRPRKSKRCIIITLLIIYIINIKDFN